MSKLNWPNKSFVAVAIWLAALLIRLAGLFVPAQNYDMSTFEAWSHAWWQYGPRHFFTSVWSDYLPLPIMTFAPLSLLSDGLSLPFSAVFRLFHSLLELGLIALIPGLSLWLRGLLLFSPALIADTAYWGQVDAIPALLGVLAAMTCTTRPHTVRTVIQTALYLGLAVAYKPIMIIIAPALWIVSVKKGWKFWELPLISAAICFLTGIPTGGAQAITHVFARVFDQTGTYPYLTVNAFNLYSLVPTHIWIPDDQSVLGISGHLLGLILFAALGGKLIWSWSRSHWDPRQALRIAGTLLIVFYTVTTRMHERHLLFGLPFLALAVGSAGWLIYPLGLLTTTFVLNLVGAYLWVAHGQTWPFSDMVIALASWINVLVAFGLALVWDWARAGARLMVWIRSHRPLVLILGLATLLRLTYLGHPQAYIFDEVYHAFTAKEYLHNHVEAWEWWTTPPEGVAYEWTHPPLAKYGMVVGMLLFGENTFGYRLGSALAGIVAVYGIYLLTRLTSKSEGVALLAAFFVSVEGTHIAQSRVAMNDAYMLVFLIFAIVAAVRARWKTAAVLYGLALASKWSALYGAVPLAYLYLRSPIYSISKSSELFGVRNLKAVLFNFLAMLRLLFITLTVYVLTFAPFILAGHTWAQWWELHRQMWYYHTHLVATHAYQSTPKEWLFDLRPVWYWVQYEAGKIANIYVVGNPLVLWLGLAASLLMLTKILVFPYTLYYLLYTIFFVPWFFSPRIMFYYHYLPSATFLTILLAQWVSRFPSRARVIVIGCCLVGLLAIAPMLYGYPLQTQFWDTYFAIMPTWK